MMAVGSRRWWALGALALSLLAVGFDLTILNVALPTMAVRLGASTSQLQWFADAYSLALAATLLPAGLLGDRHGRRALLVGALLLFGLASLACAYAANPTQLIVARALLGVAAAFLLPLSMSVVTVLFTPDERPRAIAVWAGANALGLPLGPIIGGWLLEHYWWGAAFLINVPVVVIAVAAVILLVPESRSATRPALDGLGVLTSSAGLAAVTYGVISAGEHGWGDAATLLWLAAGAVLLVGFVLWQRRTRHPLVDLGLFRSRRFTWGAVLATLVTFAMFGVLFALPQYFQAVRDASALDTGLRLLPMIGGLLVGSTVTGRLGARANTTVMVVIGFLALAGALLAGSGTEATDGYGYPAAWLAVLGLGMGFALPAAMNAATGDLSADRAGVGSALVMALRQVGGTIGVAVLGAVLTAAYHSRLGDLSRLPVPVAHAVWQGVNTGVPAARRTGSTDLLDLVRDAFTHAMDRTLLVSTGIAVAGALLAAFFLPARSATMGGGDAQEQRTGAERDVVG